MSGPDGRYPMLLGDDADELDEELLPTEAEARKDALDLVKQQLINPDQLFRVDMYRSGIQRRMQQIEVQLSSAVRAQVDETRLGLELAQNAELMLQRVAGKYRFINDRCVETAQYIQDYDRIQVVNVARNNMEITKRVLKDVLGVQRKVDRLAELLNDHDKAIKAVYKEVRALVRLRKAAMDDRNFVYGQAFIDQLTRRFTPLEGLIKMLDARVWENMEDCLMLAEEEPAVLVRTLEVIELEDQATLKVFSLDDVATTAAAQLAAAITAINQTTGGSVSPGPAGFVAPSPAAGAAAAAAAGKGGAPAASPTGAVVVATPAAKRGGRFASMRERCLHALEMLIARQFQPLAQSEEEVERKLGELDAKRKVIEERKAQEMEVAAEKARIAARLAETEKKEARLAAKGKGKRGRAGGAGGDDWDDEPPSDISSDNSGDSLDLDRIRIDSDDDNRPARAKPKPKPGATAGKGGAGKGGRKGSDVPNYFDDLDDSDGGGGGGGAGKSKPATDAAARRRNRSEDDDSGGSDADSRGSSADGDGSDGKGGRGSTGVRIVGQTAAQAASMSPSPGQQRKGDYLSGVLQKLRGVMGDLEGLDSATRCFPPAYNIRDFFLKRYAKWCRTVLQFHLADMSRLTKQSTLDVILFIEWFLDEMLRLGAEKGPADEYDITIKELVGRYVDSTRKTITTMVENMLRVEESTAPVEDEDGHLITTGPQDFFTVLNQQIDIMRRTGMRGKAMFHVGVMFADMCKLYQQRQVAFFEQMGRAPAEPGVAPKLVFGPRRVARDDRYFCAMINNSHQCSVNLESVSQHLCEAITGKGGPAAGKPGAGKASSAAAAAAAKFAHPNRRASQVAASALAAARAAGAVIPAGGGKKGGKKGGKAGKGEKKPRREGDGDGDASNGSEEDGSDLDSADDSAGDVDSDATDDDDAEDEEENALELAEKMEDLLEDASHEFVAVAQSAADVLVLMVMSELQENVNRLYSAEWLTGGLCVEICDTLQDFFVSFDEAIVMEVYVLRIVRSCLLAVVATYVRKLLEVRPVVTDEFLGRLTADRAQIQDLFLEWQELLPRAASEAEMNKLGLVEDVLRAEDLGFVSVYFSRILEAFPGKAIEVMDGLLSLRKEVTKAQRKDLLDQLRAQQTGAAAAGGGELERKHQDAKRLDALLDNSAADALVLADPNEKKQSRSFFDFFKSNKKREKEKAEAAAAAAAAAGGASAGAAGGGAPKARANPDEVVLSLEDFFD